MRNTEHHWTLAINLGAKFPPIKNLLSFVFQHINPQTNLKWEFYYTFTFLYIYSQ